MGRSVDTCRAPACRGGRAASSPRSCGASAGVVTGATRRARWAGPRACDGSG